MSKYIKPDISFQSLTLNSSTSSSCAIQNTFEIYKCKQQVPGFLPGQTIFSVEMDCYFDQSQYGGLVCYHAPTEGANVFDS